MKTVVGAVAEQIGLMLVGALVEIVTQLVVDSGEVLAGDVDAHLDAQVFFRIHIPGAGVADHFAVARLDEQGPLPEAGRERRKSERGEEALAVARHLLRFGILRFQDLRQVEAGVGVRGRNQRVNVLPTLRPHVAEQVRRDRAIGGDHARSVLFAQLASDVGVKGQVERANLAPELVELLGESVGRHVILGAPHRSRVGEAQLARALIGQRDVALERLAQGRRDGVPAHPALAQLFHVAAVRHRLGEVFEVIALRAGAVFALSISAFHAGDDARELLTFLRVGGRRHGERKPEELHLAGEVVGQCKTVESLRLLHQIDRRVDRPLIGLGSQGLGIVRDVVVLDPIGAAGVDR